jgi:DNA-binding GntR family transcriptional regulator
MDTDVSFSRIQAKSLARQIVEQLRSLIFDGRLPPGSALREQHLAGQFGVSQNTVREALLELQHLGLVERQPNRATYVTKLSDAEIRERLAVRTALEQIACVAAAGRMQAADFERLALCLEAITRAQHLNDYSGYAVADLEFHRSIWQAAGNRTLYRVLDQLTAPLFAFLNILQHDRSMILVEVARSHELILHALQTGDTRIIRTTIREHAEDSYDRVLRWLPNAGHPVPARSP